MSADPISWYLANRPVLLGFLRLCAPHDVAEDAVQETFIVLQRTSDRFRPGADPGAWVRGIARNLAKQMLTTRGRLHLLPLETLIDAVDHAVAANETAAASAAGTPVAPDDLEHLARCMSALEQRQQELLHDRYQQGLSLRELADKTARSPGAIQVALSRLRSVLEACIDQARRRAP